MNKFEIAPGLYRQNVYNLNLGDNHYSHVMCYFDKDKNIIEVFSAGKNYGILAFEDIVDLKPLILSDEIRNRIKEVLLSWTYNHIEPVELYKDNPMWKGIFEITTRDRFVINRRKE